MPARYKYDLRTAFAWCEPDKYQAAGQPKARSRGAETETGLADSLAARQPCDCTMGLTAAAALPSVDMIDRLDSVFRRYERICSDENEPGLKLRAEALADWLDRDVCPVVQELLERPDFRTWARWPIERLAEGASGEERGLIEAVDTALVRAGETLAAFAELAAAQSALVRSEAAGVSRSNSTSHPTLSLADHPDEIGQQGGSSARPSVDAISQALAGMKFIASRPWVDLVAIGDYFTPVNDLNLCNRETFLGPNTRHVQIGEFSRYCNPRLRPLGDFISRTLLIRVEFWQNMIQTFWTACQRMAHENQLADCQEWSNSTAAMRELSECAEALRHGLMDDRQLRLREACLALVQIYASFRPRADFSFLGSLAKLVGNAGAFRYLAVSRQVLAIPEQIAAALTEAASLYRSQEDPEERIRELSMRHSLLIVEGPGRREAYWKGELLGADWQKHEKPWNLLLALAERQLLSRGADGFDANCSAKDARHRLKQLIPDDLNEKIVPAGRGTYKLELGTEEVCILQCRDQPEQFAPLAPARRNR